VRSFRGFEAELVGTLYSPATHQIRPGHAPYDLLFSWQEKGIGYHEKLQRKKQESNFTTAITEVFDRELFSLRTP